MIVAVVNGGFSEERHSSRKSGKSISDALEALGHTVANVEYDENLLNSLKQAAPDAVFPVVQGKHHGDGAIQALLEMTGIPYVGSRPQAAAIINHKIICKQIWRAAGISTPAFFTYRNEEYEKDSFDDFKEKVKSNGLTLPVVVKAPTQGGRFGMVFAHDRLTFRELEGTFQYDSTLLVERYVKGCFITQGIIEVEGKMTTLPPVEIIDPSDAKFKRFSGGTTYRAHHFTPELQSEISRTTLEAADLTGAAGFARLDYHISNEELFLLEINAVPGLVPGYSDMCKCAEAAGHEYTALIGALLATARKR